MPGGINSTDDGYTYKVCQDQPDEEDCKYFLTKSMEGQTEGETCEVFLVIDASGAPVWQNLPFKF